jgi:hypothetical protein
VLRMSAKMQSSPSTSGRYRCLAHCLTSFEASRLDLSLFGQPVYRRIE